MQNLPLSMKTVLLGLMLTVTMLITACSAPSEKSVEGQDPEDGIMQESLSPSSSGGMKKFLAISDVHYAKSGGFWGGETDQSLWSAAITKATAIVTSTDPEEKPDFIIYLGDLPAHSQTIDDRKSEFTNVFDGLQTIAGTTPLFYLPGNNDSTGSDYCSFTYPPKTGVTPLDYATDETVWPAVNGKFLIIDGQHIAHGYYSAYPLAKPTTAPGLRLVALNSVMFTNRYYSCMKGLDLHKAQQDNTNTQVEWFVGQLEAAKNATISEKVLLAMHVPPGYDGHSSSVGELLDGRLYYLGTKYPQYAGKTIQDALIAIIADYSPQITSILHSHTHTNGIRRFFSCDANPNFVELGVSVPAVTTDHGTNSALKLFTMRSDFELIDTKAYYATSSDFSFSNILTFEENYPITRTSSSHDLPCESNYSCPTCAKSDALFERIKKIDDGDNVTCRMRQWLLLKEDTPADAKTYRQALDVKYGQ